MLLCWCIHFHQHSLIYWMYSSVLTIFLFMLVSFPHSPPSPPHTSYRWYHHFKCCLICWPVDFSQCPVWEIFSHSYLWLYCLVSRWSWQRLWCPSQISFDKVMVSWRFEPQQTFWWRRFPSIIWERSPTLDPVMMGGGLATYFQVRIVGHL